VPARKLPIFRNHDKKNPKNESCFFAGATWA
jgi:hypothetical protein